MKKLNLTVGETVKIELVDDGAWVCANTLIQIFDTRNCPKQKTIEHLTFYKTRMGNLITRYYYGGNYWYRKPTEEDMSILNNRYTFPPEEEI